MSIESRDLALVDIAHHTVRRIMEARKNENVQDNYPNYDYGAFARNISTLLDQILDESTLTVNNVPVVPPVAPAPPSTPAVTPLSPLGSTGA